MENCKELFLEDIVGLSVVPADSCTFPVPSFVMNIITMSNYSLSEPVLTIGYDDDNVKARQGSITAKCTPNTSGSGVVNSMEISAQVDGDDDILREAYINIRNKDHYVILQKADGSLFLCYSLPNTFLMNTPATIQGSYSKQISMTLKSYSEFIKIGIQQN